MKTFTIGQLVKETGLTRRALRLYEREGLLVVERQPNNYRVYDERHLKDALVIKELRASGLSLKTIQALFAIKRASVPVEEKLGQCLALLDEMHAELVAKRHAIDIVLERLEEDRREIHALLAEEPKLGEKHAP